MPSTAHTTTVVPPLRTHLEGTTSAISVASRGRVLRCWGVREKFIAISEVNWKSNRANKLRYQKWGTIRRVTKAGGAALLYAMLFCAAYGCIWSARWGKCYMRMCAGFSVSVTKCGQAEYYWRWALVYAAFDQAMRAVEVKRRMRY